MRHHGLVLCLALLPACSSSTTISGGQTGEEKFGCVPVEERALGRDEVSPIGVAPSDVLALVTEPYDTLLWWSKDGSPESDGTNTGATFSFTPKGAPARYVREEPRGTQELAVDCSAYVVVSAGLEFRTADGAFDETWASALRAEAPTRARAQVTIEWSRLNGSYDFDRIVPEGHTALNGHLSVELSSSGGRRAAVGLVSGLAEVRQGGSVSARYLQVGLIGDDVAGR